MLELINVSKVYRHGKVAVDDLTITLGQGVLGLLGPNGAGKSSLLRMIATVTRPTSGRILFDGTDIVDKPEALRRTLGYLPQDFGFYPNLSAREFLSYLAAAKGLNGRSAKARIAELLEMVNLTEAAKRPLGGYSGGMLRRVGIAQTLLTDPRVVVVDEPTAGLDPEERVRFRNLISSLATDRVVLLSTHIVSDVQSVSGDIAIMTQGRIRRRGTPEQLLSAVEGQVWETTIPAAHVPQIQSAFLISRMVQTSRGVRVRVLSPTQPRGLEVTPVTPDLEDAYLSIVQASSDYVNVGPQGATR